MIYPCHVYCSPGPYQTTAKAPTWGCKTVHDAAEHHAALCSGWHDSKSAAIESARHPKHGRKPAVIGQNQKQPEPAQASDDAAPPTRSEMEAKARDLGLKFDGRTGDALLLKRIEAALKG